MKIINTIIIAMGIVKNIRLPDCKSSDDNPNFFFRKYTLFIYDNIVRTKYIAKRNLFSFADIYHENKNISKTITESI